MQEIYLSDVQFSARYGNHKSWPWRRVKQDPDFPRPIRLSPGCTRWKLTDIEDWEQRKSAEH